MKPITALLFVLSLLFASGLLQANATSTKPVIHHQLQITPDTSTGKLQVIDQITVPETLGQNFVFQLNSAFQLSIDDKATKPTNSTAPVSTYQIPLNGKQTITLNYQGQLKSTPECSWLTQGCLLLNQQGIFLDGNSHWYPQGDFQHTFALTVKLPDNWASLSQGKQIPSGWTETQPQRSIYLLAGPFHVYESEHEQSNARAIVYLQQDDPELAKRYLQTTHQYLQEYSELLGDYPYAKFATVESFWETGWGMPSFTLLGPKVMRLPFILHSSFPHEILHNWWGNGVYVDASSGNWSEGLTAYLADHRNKEKQGQDVNYRRDTLQKYAAFTASGEDFPLKQFRSRHDRTTQAVGYGKALMLFHMLHEQLGEETFFTALQHLYRDFRFQAASFQDIKMVFETVSQEDLADFFKQWLERTGAPQIAIESHKITQQGENHRLEFIVKQTQGGEPYELWFPIHTELQDGSLHKLRRGRERKLRLFQTRQTFSLPLPPKTAKVTLDPNFDTFRKLDRREIPPALNVLFNRQPKTFVLSRKVPEGMELAWDEVVDTFSWSKPNANVQYDDAELPDDDIIVLLGGDNAMLSSLLERAKQSFKLTETAYTLNGENYVCGLHSLALTLQAGGQQIILLDASTPSGLEKLLRKLPHYGKYSYVLFNSATGENVAKGQWEVKDSPLSIRIQ